MMAESKGSDSEKSRCRIFLDSCSSRVRDPVILRETSRRQWQYQQQHQAGEEKDPLLHPPDVAGKIGNRSDGGQNLIKLQGGFQSRRSHQVGGAIDPYFAGAVERSLRIVLVIGNNGLDQGITGFFSRR